MKRAIAKYGVAACALALLIALCGCSAASTTSSSSSASSTSSAQASSTSSSSASSSSSSSAAAESEDASENNGEAVEDDEAESNELKDVTNVSAQVDANDNGTGCTAEVLNKAVDAAGYAGFTLKVNNNTDQDLLVINGKFTINNNAATAFVQDTVKAHSSIESFVFFFNGASSVSDLNNVKGTIYLQNSEGDDIADFAISF